ncbi:MAG: arylsulfatase, partial [Planctomycetales bacterium]|nr:arylsulfatase [Planctomycetales bacterium]
GTPQKKIEGVSMAYTFDEQRESAPSTRTRQYFEMFGNRAIYDEGWLAACRHGRLPWVTAGSYSFDDDVWELYDLTNDFSEADDLAEQMPEKLRNMQDLFLVEAAKYNVLPLDDRFAERLDVTLRPSYFYGRKHVTFFPGMVRLPEGSGPKFSNVSHKVSVAIEMADLDESGVLFCVGGDTGGFSVFVENGKLGYHYNYFDVERYEARSKESIPTGASNLGFEFQNQTNKPGGPAAVNLLINEKVVGSLHVVHQTPNRFGIEVMDVGVDSLSPVSKTYPRGEGFAFTGVIKRVDIYLGDDALETSPEENLCMVLASD